MSGGAPRLAATEADPYPEFMFARMLCLTGSLAVMALSPGVLAQAPSPEADIPPEPGLAGGLPVWLGFLIIFVLFAAIVMVSLMPSKRSHQPD